MIKRNLKLTLVIGTGLVALTFGSCNNNTATTEKTETTVDTTVTDTKRIDSLTPQKKDAIEYKFATTEANLPAPFEVVNDIASYQAEYKKGLLNSSANADYYVTTYKKAVNMGVYGIDLAYVNFYGQNQEMLHYFTTIQKIAKDLSFDKVFDQFSERFKTNADQKDSVISIVDNVFDKTDAYLKKNQNYLVASHILAGALIEINYLSLNLLKETKRTPENEPVFEKVYKENLYIYHLIKLFEEYTDKDSKDLLARLKAYRTAYDETIKSPADLTPENIGKMSKLITDIRNGLTKK
jgi:hypothetical protein